MTQQCNNNEVISDVEQRIIRLAAKIYSHTNLVNQFEAEKERLQCLLENLQAQGGDDDSSGDDDAPVDTSTNTIVYSTGTVVNQDGPWK